MSSRVISLLRGKASLACDSSGIPSPTVVWFKDNHFLDNKTDPRRSVIDGLVEILSAQLDDIGEYVCVATNKGGNSSVTIALDVHCKLLPCCHTFALLSLVSHLFIILFSCSNSRLTVK